MVRWIGNILLLGFMGCVAAQMRAQAPKDERTAAQTPTAEAAAGQTSAPLAKPEFPLDAFREFSAVMVGSRMEMGDGTSEAHIYRSGNLLRMQGEGQSYVITDLSTLETYGVSALSCMHDTHPYFRASPFAASRPGTTVERIPAGKEARDGHPCQIEDISVSSVTPGFPPLKMRMWEAEDLQGFPIRIEMPVAGGKYSAIRYKNVVLGPQDPSLFIHPKSCSGLPQPPKTAPKPAAAAKKPAAAPPVK